MDDASSIKENAAVKSDENWVCLDDGTGRNVYFVDQITSKV